MVTDSNRDRVLRKRHANHVTVIQHTAGNPERYRVLVPYLIEPFTRALSTFLPYEKAFDRVFAVFSLLLLVALLWSQFAYLRRWFTEQEALIGCLVVATTMAINLQQPYALWSHLESIFAALLFLLILDDRRILIGVVIALASLNRETAIFLVMMYAVTAPLSVRNAATTLVYLGIWAAIYLGLRAWLGMDLHLYRPGTWQINLIPINMATSAVNALLFLGAFWIFAAMGVRRAPPLVRRSAIIVPIYLAFFTQAQWWEVRPFMTLYPILLPLALSYLLTARPVPLTREECRAGRGNHATAGQLAAASPA
jgi:hypothetical protein